MATFINIGMMNVNDPFYRYKMPSLILSIKGKGNGIRTYITNIDDIAKSLARSQIELMKFFGYELGTLAKGSLLNGKFDEIVISELLEKYITKYILCNICKNPETFYIIKKKVLKCECKACGSIYDIDTSHRLSDYILKHI
jgi:translation initiation factor 5